METRQNELRDKLQQVAHILGAEFIAGEIDPGWWAAWHKMQMLDGTRITLECSADASKPIRVSPDWPRRGNSSDWFKPYTGAVGSINCTAAKSADVLARDIKRRLIDPLTPQYAEMLARKAATEDYEGLSRANAERLATACGEMLPDGKDTFSCYRSQGGYIGKCRANGGSIDIELHSVPMDVAMQIVGMFNKFAHPNEPYALD